MKLTINTLRLQALVSKAIRGVGNNKLLPITSMLGITVDNNIDGNSKRLTLTTTDGSNYLFVIADNIDGDDFSVTVYADVFSKLIARTTSETVTISLSDKYLEVSGNGSYKIELPFDDNGKIIKFPNPVRNNPLTSIAGTITKSSIDVILNSVEPAIATSLEAPQYTAYWVNDRVVATDSFKVASYKIKVFDQPRLINAQMMELLSLTDTEKYVITTSTDETSDEVMFATQDCVIYGKFAVGIEDYSIDAVNDLLDSEFGSSCEVDKVQVLQVLDRASLFIRPFDDNTINLTFTSDGLVITSIAGNSSETISYGSITDFIDFTCSVDINLLQSQIKSNIGDLVKIYFGRPECIKIVDGMITKIVALNE